MNSLTDIRRNPVLIQDTVFNPLNDALGQIIGRITGIKLPDLFFAVIEIRLPAVIEPVSRDQDIYNERIEIPADLRNLMLRQNFIQTIKVLQSAQFRLRRL